jgi:hypothetical protein
MDRRRNRRISASTCGLCLILIVAGCTTWSDERQKHYSWLYEKCMRGERQPYTIHMSRNHNSPLPQRCREEYTHYVGDEPTAAAKTYQVDRRLSAGFMEAAEKGRPN